MAEILLRLRGTGVRMSLNDKKMTVEEGRAHKRRKTQALRMYSRFPLEGRSSVVLMSLGSESLYTFNNKGSKGFFIFDFLQQC